ncbi:MAG: septal ring lytic transglycosylase RlpA family protein [Candidatus Obscuribacterales bacterium]|nr:septal ring lytic transglycosylase RlpA family protein [Candidatus Obscuribacterales bacterium]
MKTSTNNKHWLDFSGTTFGAVLLLMTIVAPSCRANSSNLQTWLLIADKSTSTNTSSPKSFSGNASWYGPGFHGKKTASGQIFDMNKCTAAHLKLPFSTRVLVEDPRTGNTVIVTINDRGPYVRTRVMDLAKGAAKRLGTFSRGVAYIDCLVLDD